MLIWYPMSLETPSSSYNLSLNISSCFVSSRFWVRFRFWASSTVCFQNVVSVTTCFHISFPNMASYHFNSSAVLESNLWMNENRDLHVSHYYMICQGNKLRTTKTSLPEAVFLVRLGTSWERASSQLGTSPQCFSHIPRSQPD